MTFTPLHKALGVGPCPLTNELLDAAVTAKVTESYDLDWKSKLPPLKGITQTDFPKDVAAMANSGGGLIVFGVKESQKAATERVDVGDLGEGYERALRSAAITAITPPVFGLNVFRLGSEGHRAVVVEVPASVDGPHLIYKDYYFGAPVRNDADTVWMKERQIEAMYRARFDERRHASEALDSLYSEISKGKDSNTRAWLVAVARPRVPRVGTRVERDEARAILKNAESLSLTYASSDGIHPLDNVDRHNPRPGLRRWQAVNNAIGENSIWKEAWINIHYDGSVTIATAIGGHRMSRDGYFDGWEVQSRAIECAVADLMSLVRATAEELGSSEYDIRVGINFAGEESIVISTVDNFGYHHDGVSVPLHQFTPVEMTVNTTVSDADFHQRVYELALDCVNQGGVANLQLIHRPQEES